MDNRVVACLGESLTKDEVGGQSGWRFHVDGVHLNSRSGKILADLVQEFVAA